MKSNKNKGIIFFVPNWEKPSELWLNRMILNLEDVLTGIICPDAQSNLWGNKITAYSTKRNNFFLARVLNKILSKKYLNKLNENYLLRLLNSDSVHVVSIHYLTLAVRYFDVIIRVKKPVYVHCHGYDVTWDLMDTWDPQKKMHSDDYIEKAILLARSSFFIANSLKTVDNLKKIGIPSDRIHLCNYGIPVGAGKTKIQNDELTILYLGRLVDFKGPELVMLAFDIAYNKGLEARLIIAGDGPLRVTCELLKRQLNSSDKIKILGEVSWEQGEALIQEADIFTAHNRKGPLTNQEEAFGASIVEAMAAGIPVITGNNGGCRETVLNNETGILVEPGNIEAHADAFILLGTNQDLRYNMGEKARERVKLKFSPESERNRLTEIYGI